MGQKKQIDVAALIASYEAGESAMNAARRLNVSVWTIISRLRSCGVAIRSAREQNARRLPHGLNARLIETLDGLLLGDGSIDRKGGFFRIEQGVDRAEWIDELQAEFVSLGLDVVATPMRSRERMIEGRRVRYRGGVLLRTASYRELREVERRWYGQSGRTVPADLRLTPRAAALWFCGDGTYNSQGGLTLCTQRYKRSDVDRLRQLLFDNFAVESLRLRHRKAWTIVINRAAMAVRFSQVIRPFMSPCCLYKLRFVQENEKSEVL